MRRRSLRGVLVAAFALCLAAAAFGPGPAREYRFRRDHVLGTSFDLSVVVPGLEHAEACEEVVLAEIERLRKILSAWDGAGGSGLPRWRSASSPPC